MTIGIAKALGADLVEGPLRGERPHQGLLPELLQPLPLAGQGQLASEQAEQEVLQRYALVPSPLPQGLVEAIRDVLHLDRSHFPTFPTVLAGGTTAADDDSSGLLLIRREMGVPKTEGAGATWSVDHLFVADDGVPVVVEVKRSSDTRIRREVVGQMLDYAANAVRYWPVSALREALEETAAADGSSGDERVQELAGDGDVEEFWERVSSNLAGGRIRMVFVADHLPDELIRVIEFLNEQMSPAEVLGVEVPQFVGAGHQVLVPRLIGRTATAVAAKQSSNGTPWNETTFLDATTERHGDEVAAVFTRLFGHVHDRGAKFSWGRGASPGVSGWYHVAGPPSAVWTANAGTASPTHRAYVYLYLPDLRRRLDPALFDRCIAALAAIPPFAPRIEEARAEGFATRHPAVFIGDLVAAPGAVDRLIAAIEMLLPAPPSS